MTGKEGLFMKEFARRNQLIITGLAIMIAVAGYLHFTSEGGAELSEAEPDSTKTEETQWISEKDAQAYILTDDDDSVETMAEAGKEEEDGEPVSADAVSENAVSEDAFADISAEDLGEDDNMEVAQTDEQTAEAGSSIGEAVLVNNTIEGDYFSSAKLSREQTRAKNEETLMEIVNNAKMENAQRQEAVNSLIDLTEKSEMETAAETLLGAKGFQNVIVTITEGSVDVVVDGEGLTKQQIVQIQDIVKRKTGVSAENIVITPVAVKE